MSDFADKTQDGSPQRFRLGHIVATPGALRLLATNQQSADEFLRRHAGCDWGDLDAEDKQLNDAAVAHEADPELRTRILSAYRTRNNERLWVITEADRASTILLQPEEY
ncbi:MAG: hypothetical protein QM754_16350 [Tepidisphaeraceae bacterium]